MLKSKLLVLVAAACVTGVCSAGISGGGATPQGISGGGAAVQPYCLIQINLPFMQQPFCFV